MACCVDGKTYKIVNTVSQECLHVVDGSSNNAAVKVTPWKNLANQCWKAVGKDTNTFEFAVNNQPTKGTTYVLDYAKNLGNVCLYGSHGTSENQSWIIEPIKANAFLNFIKSKADNKVLEYNGANNVALLRAKDASNPKQHWILQEQ